MRNTCARAAGVLLCGAALTVAQSGRLEVGKVVDYRGESPHPYPPGRGDRPTVWSDRVQSPGAAFLRIHFVDFNLAPGDYLTVSNLDGSHFWTYTGRGPQGDGDFWSFAVDGDTAFLEIHAGPRAEHGYRIDAVGHGTVGLGRGRPKPQPEIVCGTDGRENVACHLPDVEAAQKPVARLLFVSGAYQYVCTGWLVRGSQQGTLITNNHCIDTRKETRSLQASFGYQQTGCMTNVMGMATDYAGGLLLQTNKSLDYTLLTLQGSPEATSGELTPSLSQATAGEDIWLIQHPGGNAKKIGYYEDTIGGARCDVHRIDQTYSGTAKRSQMAYACDTEGGSSGSPVIRAGTTQVIGLHHLGGVARNACLNAATEMHEICAAAGSLLNCVLP